MAGPDSVLGRFFVGMLFSVLGRDLGFVVAASPGVVLVLGDGFSVDRLFAGISELKRDFEFGVASAGAIAVLGGCSSMGRLLLQGCGFNGSLLLELNFEFFGAG